MRDNGLTKERDKELYRIYRQGLREHTFANMHDAVDWVRSQPASRYYISSKALVNYIGAIQQGRPLNLHDYNAQKVQLLYHNFLDFTRRYPDSGLSRERICEMLVDEPAPIFFIGHDSCIKAILRERARYTEAIVNRYTK